jgi:hypothetical protein
MAQESHKSIPTKQFQVSDLPLTNPNGVQPIYANVVGVFNSSYDVRLNFSEVFVMSLADAHKPHHELRASIVLTKEQTKSLSTALEAIVKQIDGK